MLAPLMVALLFFASGTVVLASGIFTMQSNNKAPANRTFFALTAAIAIWSFGMAMSAVANNSAMCEIFRRVSAIGWGTAYAILLHFILIITGKSSSYKKRWLYLCLYIPALFTIYAFAVPNGLHPFPYDLHQTAYGWINVAQNDIWDWIFYAYYIGFTITGLVILHRWGKKAADEVTRKKTRIVSLSIVAALVLGTITDVVLSSLFSELPQLAPVIMLIPALTIFHALQNDNFGITEGIGKRTSYITLFTSVLIYMIISNLQFFIPKDGFAIGSVIYNESVMRGIIVQIQMFISIYLVLREKRPGYIAAVILNFMSLLSAIGFYIRYGTGESFPGIISYIGVLVIITLIKAYKENNAAYLKRVNALNEKLAIDEALFRSVFYQAPVGIAIMQDKIHANLPEFGYATVNPTYAKILGRQEDDFQNMTWIEITHPEDLAADLEKFDQFKKGEINGYSMEKRFIKPDGSFVWTLMTVSPLLGVFDDHSMHLCLIEDITSRKAAEAALIESEKKYRTITEEMSDVIWQTDLNLEVTYISPSVEKLLGGSVEEHMNRRMEEKFPDPTLQKLKYIILEQLEKENDPQVDKNRSWTMEVDHHKEDGTVVWLEINVSFIRDENGNAVGFQGASRDITQRKLAEIALKENERRVSVLLSHLPGLAYRCKYDRDRTMLFVSDGCYDLTGYLPECFINNKALPFNNIILPEYRETLWAEWERTIPARLPYKCEYEVTTAAGGRKWVLEMGQGIFNDEGEVETLEGIILDISDRKEMENRLIYINEHNKLTGLYNRDYLESLLNRDIRKRDGLKRAIIAINLRTVQLLTANYGFHYTQNLIKEVAETLSQYCSGSRLLFQTYENRFVFYLTGYKDKLELVVFCNAIGKALESLFVADRINGGIGILEIEQSDTETDVDLLLKRLLIASERSLAASDKYFGICFYNEALEALINREGEIRQSLAGIAIGNTGDELFLQYQPVFDLRSNSVCGFEALARLRTEKLGLVSPVEFIPIAEITKLIIPIGEKVIVNALHFLKKLNERGYDEISVFINVSAIQLLQPDFTSRLLELISEIQVDPKNIGIEITESVFTSDYEYINHTLDILRDAGLHIAIDDFGTGYSSLAREKELVVDCLKIDKFFIDRLLETDPHKAITSDIISMSHKLGHCTIAEGVEHETQLQYLKEHDCDRIQGYLISKPLDEKDALDFLQKQEQSAPIIL